MTKGYIRHDGPGRIDGMKKHYAYGGEGIQYHEYKLYQSYYARYKGDLI